MRLRENWMSAEHALHWAFAAQSLAGDESTKSQLGRMKDARGGLPGDRAASLRAQAQMIYRVAEEALRGDPVARLVVMGRRTLDSIERQATARTLYDQINVDDMGQAPAIEVCHRWLLRPHDRDYVMRQLRIDGQGAINVDAIGKDYGIPRNAFRRMVEQAELMLDAIEQRGLAKVESAMHTKGWINVN